MDGRANGLLVAAGRPPNCCASPHVCTDVYIYICTYTCTYLSMYFVHYLCYIIRIHIHNSFLKFPLCFCQPNWAAKIETIQNSFKMGWCSSCQYQCVFPRSIRRAYLLTKQLHANGIHTNRLTPTEHITDYTPTACTPIDCTQPTADQLVSHNKLHTKGLLYGISLLP